MLFLSNCSDKDKNIAQPKSANGVAEEVIGPFSLPATLTKVASYEKIVFSKPTNGLAAGVYFCDVYRSDAKVTLSAGQLMIYDPNSGASKIGYADYANQVVGTYSGQTGNNNYTFATYSLIVRSNLLGQNLNVGPLSRDLTSNVYTYSTFKL